MPAIKLSVWRNLLSGEDEFGVELFPLTAMAYSTNIMERMEIAGQGVEEDSPRTHAAVAMGLDHGRRILELIRVSKCQPIPRTGRYRCAICVRVLKNLVNFVHLCGQLSVICVNMWCQCGSHLRFHSSFVSWRSWRFNPIRGSSMSIRVHPWFFPAVSTTNLPTAVFLRQHTESIEGLI